MDRVPLLPLLVALWLVALSLSPSSPGAVVRVCDAASSPPQSISPAVPLFMDGTDPVDGVNLQALVLGSDALYIAASLDSTTGPAAVRHEAHTHAGAHTHTHADAGR